jgi:hypothetical protein
MTEAEGSQQVSTSEARMECSRYVRNVSAEVQAISFGKPHGKVQPILI